MLANYLIGLREGIEAALIVSILVTYLVKLGEKRHVAKVLWGVALAVIVAIAVGVALGELEAVAPGNAEVLITGSASMLAVIFVTWMIFWMARQSRAMSANLRGQIDAAVTKSEWSLATVAFLAVIREGVETSLFIWSTTKTASNGTAALAGAILGLLTAAILGYFMYRGSLRFNIGTFFKYTGGFLIVVAGGIFAYSLGEFQEIGWLPLLTQHAYDVSALVPDGSVQDSILGGTIAFNAAPSVLQSLAWFAYLAVVGGYFLRSNAKKK